MTALVEGPASATTTGSAPASPQRETLSPLELHAVTTLATTPLSQRKVAESLGRHRATVGKMTKRANVQRAMSEVAEASLREASLTAANIKRRLWLLSHDAEAQGQFAPAVSAVVALHRDVERQSDNATVNVQIVRIGGRDIYF